ncbi:MAG: class I SAM-dependent methyltransferase [Methanoregulaceae archaeon]|nr:class I SAM-dependent methyltransferase [Methanoregulaceae archaeon]
MPGLFPGARVLETGCGDGKSLLAMAGRGWDIVAIDFSREAVRISSAHHALHGVRFLQADAGAMPFAGETFDSVFLSHILGHIPAKGRSRVASEAGRVLIPGGAIFLRVFSVRDFREGTGILIEPHTFRRGDGILTHYFSEHEVESLFPGLVPVALRTVEWSLRVKGEPLLRSEIMAEFRK